MGIFSDHVVEFFESGLICIPVGDRKAPIQKGWEKYCDAPPTAAEVDEWERKFAGVDRIGLCMGQSSQIVAFDFDYEYDERRVKLERAKFDKDLRLVESHILRVLPQTPAIKIGKKGWTRFFRWSPQLGAGSNVSADRNGVRLFDFLSWHKQTIIPPSIHSTVDGKPLVYRWVGAPLADCLDDLPLIELDTVYEIARLFGDPKAMDINSRHGRLFSWLMRMTIVERDAEVLTRLLLAKDLEVNGQDLKGPYLRDTTHFRSGTPEANARRWVERVLGWKAAKAERAGVPGKVEEKADSEVWSYFFDKSFPVVRKDVMTKKVFIRPAKKLEWTDMVNLEGTLRTMAIEAGLPRTEVKDRLERYVFEKADESFLCDLPAWDGVDRLSVFARAVKTPNFTPDEMGLILKHWGSNVFRRIKNPQIQNRCLLLKGVQGIGKDSWVKAMLNDFQPYFETASLSGTQKDVYELISRLYVLHIEEFDQTKNLDVAFIKSIITQASVFFRESYGRAPGRKNVAVSFITTANVDDILRDPTGNRRFIVVPTTSVDWTYPKGQSGQVLAQMLAHADRDEHDALPVELEAKIKTLLEDYTPPDTNDLILELWRERGGNLTRMYGKSWFSTIEAITALNEIAKQVGVSLRRVQTILKVNRYSKHSRAGTTYYESTW